MNTERTAPVVVGGLNGSGTRVVAEILQKAGFYMGRDFNNASDNLWFTLLLKRPQWYRSHQQPDDPDVQVVIDLLERVMFGEALSVRDWRCILAAATLYSFEQRSFKSVWVLRRLRRMLSRKPVDLADYRGWGWKEPHSHFYLPHLAHHYPGLRYVQVIRHGLDMAYGGNQEQVYKWAQTLGLPAPSGHSGHDEAQRSLDFWIAANRRAVNIGQETLGDRFLLLQYDHLCEAPHTHIERLFGFLGVVDVDIDALTTIPRISRTTGRYRARDIREFSASQIQAVREFGFEVEA